MKQKSFPYRQIIHPFVCKQLDTGYLHGDFPMITNLRVELRLKFEALVVGNEKLFCS